MAISGDRTVKIIVTATFILYAAVLIAGLAMHQLLWYTALLNAVAGLVLISYWVWDKMRPLQRVTERRELLVLLLESLCVAAAVYTLIATPLPYWLVIVQYIIFACHAILLLLFLIFMFTFKMKKLF